eukprot:scaffold21393_cov122-Isochrysis_galbana.AAC.5
MGGHERCPVTRKRLVGDRLGEDVGRVIVGRSLLSLGPGAEGRSHYLGGGSPLRCCPPETSFEQRMRREHEFRRGLSGSSQRAREQIQNKNKYSKPHSSSLSVNLSLGLALS